MVMQLMVYGEAISGLWHCIFRIIVGFIGFLQVFRGRIEFD